MKQIAIQNRMNRQQAQQLRQLLLPLPQQQLFLPLHQPLPLLALPLGLRNQVPTHRYHSVPRLCPCYLLRNSNSRST